jgi:glycosyltransferase involved in cell wall biosynthesis
MHILIVTPLYPPDIGRLSVYVKEVASRLSKEHSVQIATYGRFPESVPGVDIVCTDKSWRVIIRTLLFTIRLWKAARNANLLYVSDGASVGLPAVLVSRLRKIPMTRFVIEDEARERAEQMTHTTISEEAFTTAPPTNRKIRFIQRLQAWVLRQAKHVLVPTESLKTIFTRAYRVPKQAIAVQAYPPGEPELTPFRATRLPFQILVTSPLSLKNGISTLLEALPTLLKRFPDLQLVLANDGPDIVEIKQKVKDLELSESVKVLGPISRVERWFLLRTSTLLLAYQSPSLQVDDVYQALSACTPVIAADTSEYRSIIQHDESGLLINTKDPESVEKALSELLEDPAKQQMLSANGTNRLQELAGWAKHIKAITSL